MAKLGPKAQNECRRHEAFEVAGGGGWGPPRPPEAGECWCLSVPFGLYAALFHPVVECILNLPGLFKSEMPVETIGPCPAPAPALGGDIPGV